MFPRARSNTESEPQGSEKPIPANPLTFKRSTRKRTITAAISRDRQASTPGSIESFAHSCPARRCQAEPARRAPSLCLPPGLSLPAGLRWLLRGGYRRGSRRTTLTSPQHQEALFPPPSHRPPPTAPQKAFLGTQLLPSGETDRAAGRRGGLCVSLWRPGHPPGRTPGKVGRRPPRGKAGICAGSRRRATATEPGSSGPTPARPPPAFSGERGFGATRRPSRI